MKLLRSEMDAFEMKDETGFAPVLPNATRWAGYCPFSLLINNSGSS
jgi:hypothetical protein